MADKFFQFKAFCNYWLDSVDEHSLHSPFFFDFYTRIVKPSPPGKETEVIENLRQKLLHDHRRLQTADYGSGIGSNHKTVSSIAKTSLSPAPYSAMYSRIIDHFKSRTIIELGTSFGINALYLGMRKETSVTTFEGSPEIAEIALLTFEFAGAANIRLVPGNLDTSLPLYLQSVRKIDFIMMDANHRYLPTMKYFERFLPKVTEKSVLVMDDIHYSKEMERAWNEIKNHRLVYASADLFRCGIVFFDPSLNKQHVILQV